MNIYLINNIQKDSFTRGVRAECQTLWISHLRVGAFKRQPLVFLWCFCRFFFFTSLTPWNYQEWHHWQLSGRHNYCSLLYCDCNSIISRSIIKRLMHPSLPFICSPNSHQTLKRWRLVKDGWRTCRCNSGHLRETLKMTRKKLKISTNNYKGDLEVCWNIINVWKYRERFERMLPVYWFNV